MKLAARSGDTCLNFGLRGMKRVTVNDDYYLRGLWGWCPAKGEQVSI
jgi:hypothetical protein